jgi:hypothetical protein
VAAVVLLIVVLPRGVAVELVVAGLVVLGQHLEPMEL